MRSFEAYGITSDDPDHIHCTKEGGIADTARETLKDLDESLLDVDTNCKDADVDSDCDNNEHCITHTYCSSLIVAAFIRGRRLFEGCIYYIVIELAAAFIQGWHLYEGGV